MPAALTYQDGTFTTARAVSLPVFSAPFSDQGVTTDYVLTQEWMQALTSYSPLALDTPHPDYADFMLAKEGEKRDIGGGMVQWTRTYAKLPADFSQPNGNISYNFIGFAGVGGINVPSASYRPRITEAVPVKLVRAFFRTADPLSDIPFIEATRYYFQAQPNQDVDLLQDNPPFENVTVPTRTEYEALIAADDFNIVAEASRISIWMGNIYIRETSYVKAR